MSKADRPSIKSDVDLIGLLLATVNDVMEHKETRAAMPIDTYIVAAYFAFVGNARLSSDIKHPSVGDYSGFLDEADKDLDGVKATMKRVRGMLKGGKSPTDKDILSIIDDIMKKDS